MEAAAQTMASRPKGGYAHFHLPGGDIATEKTMFSAIDAMLYEIRMRLQKAQQSGRPHDPEWQKQFTLMRRSLYATEGFVHLIPEPHQLAPSDRHGLIQKAYNLVTRLDRATQPEA